jgi:hypothetical protein
MKIVRRDCISRNDQPLKFPYTGEFTDSVDQARHGWIIKILLNSEISRQMQALGSQALDIADEQPESAIFLLPVKLDECAVPDSLHQWQMAQLLRREQL